MMVLSSSFPFYIASNFKSYETIDVPDERFISLVGSIGAVVNGLSRGVWSTLQDIFGFKIIYITLLVLEITVAFTFVTIHKIKALYFIWVLVAFATLGGHFSIFPTVCAKIYGTKMGGKIYTVLFIAFATGTLINWILSRQTSRGNIGYETLFYILASLAVISLGLSIFFKDNTLVKKVNERVGKNTEDAKLLNTHSHFSDL
mmetsp:Transcript_15888/g.17630  ORF Transcript_15888/g.17630 Transcript_15888/m.17630 type:complete len:202 (+) Transcript_15888:510-1115(+)